MVRSKPTHREDSEISGCGDVAMKPMETAGRVSLMMLSLVVLAPSAVMGAGETFRLSAAVLVGHLGHTRGDRAGRRR